MKAGAPTYGITVLLTATVTPPPGATHLVRADPALRLEGYRRAFDCYCGTLAAGAAAAAPPHASYARSDGTTLTARNITDHTTAMR